MSVQSGLFQSETWILAWQALMANKLRASLTMIGVAIGSCCIVLVVTVALSGKKYVISQIEGIGSNIIYAELANPGNSRFSATSDQLNLADLAAIQKEVAHVARVAGTRDFQMTVIAGGKPHPVTLLGVTQGFQEIRNLMILRGRYLDPDELDSHTKICLLSEELARVVFGTGDPIGSEIRVGEMNLTVIGVFRERIATFGQSEITSETVLVPYPLSAYYASADFLGTVYAQADGPASVASVTQQMKQVLQSRHRFTAKYNVRNLAGLIETAREISFALTAVLLLVSLIALTISGIGIMNIMLVTVTERTHEIGIRKAIGARNDAILYQFLTEALLISCTGALVGIAVAVAVPAFANSLISYFTVPVGITIPISWISVVFALIVSCSIGVFFGYLPASRAARLHPTDSLRFE
jgi:putative ABC transport system permease protein